MVFLVSLYYVWHLCTAWTAPARPEVYKHIVAFAGILAQLNLLVVHVLHDQIGVHQTRTAKLQHGKILFGWL